jgi:lipopolysaccharide transport system ATP-binding protein
MSNSAIKVENISKIYRLGEIGTGTISRDMERWFKTKVLKQEDPFLKIGETNDRANKGKSDIVYSLQDINFEIQQGDAVGIIGRNGAGKSTLLKILSRVTTPTTGKINIKGRVASLLEVGTGFHPELTGRENIYLNGAILGMRKREIDRKLDEIIDFSGVERYIDTPVKRYSSGMYVRLAFAVAANLESEILIVDEVLAVGDADFQAKCLGKMKDVSHEQGRTVLFVSHNLASVRVLCERSMLLENGKLNSIGESGNVINEYLNSNSSFAIKRDFKAIENDIFKWTNLSLENEKKTQVLSINDELILRFEVEFKEDIPGIAYEFYVYDKQETLVFMAFSHTLRMESRKHAIDCRIPKNILNNQFYSLSVGISKDYKYFIEKLDHIIQFELENYFDEYGWQGEIPGIIRPKCTWSINNQSI